MYKIKNFTTDETDTLMSSLRMFASDFLSASLSSEEVEFKVINILSSRTMSKKEVEDFGEDSDLIHSMNIYRNQICFFCFRNLYMMHYGMSILEIPCPFGKEKNYGLTILRSPNSYKDCYKEDYKDLWPDSTGILNWVDEGYVRVDLPSKNTFKGEPL